jgi:hypothetical protein
MVEPSHIKPEPKLKQLFMPRLVAWRRLRRQRPWPIARLVQVDSRSEIVDVVDAYVSYRQWPRALPNASLLQGAFLHADDKLEGFLSKTFVIQVANSSRIKSAEMCAKPTSPASMKDPIFC